MNVIQLVFLSVLMFLIGYGLVGILKNQLLMARIKKLFMGDLEMKAYIKQRDEIRMYRKEAKKRRQQYRTN
jgi:hypothetical protein